MGLERTPYLNKIVERCHWRMENDASFELSNLKVATISGEVLKLIYTYDTLEENDQLILKSFFQTDDPTKLILIAKKKKEAFGKAIQRLLKGETQMPNNSLIDLSALLADLQPRPFKVGFKYQTLQVEKAPKNQSKSRLKNLFHSINIVGSVGVVAIVALVLFFATFNREHDTNGERESAPSITINAENLIVSDLNKIIPNQNTQFFDKNNEPQVWYASYNNQLDFYNTKGIHPFTNEPLQPVTKEIIKTVLIEKPKKAPKKQTTNMENEISPSNSKEEISLFNTSIINTKANKEISFFIFDSINKVDRTFSNHLQQELKKDYKPTANLIIPSKLNDQIIEALKNGDIQHFKGELEKHTDFICVGNVYYTFSKNKIREDRITCAMQVDYSIISTKSGAVMESYSNIIYGNGLSEMIAKNTTIKKFKL